MMNALGLAAAILVLASQATVSSEPIAPKAWLGLRFHLQPADDIHSSAFLFIDAVAPGGPAERAGLKKQDLVVALDGKPIRFPSNVEALRFFASVRVGQKLRAQVIRNGQKREVIITPADLPESARSAWESNVKRATAPGAPR